jgi:hypothetical protein
MLSPGGAGVPAAWVTAGLAATGLAALLLPRRRTVVLTGWLLALSGLLVAILVVAAPAWPGVALMSAAAGIVLAASGVLRRAIEVLAGRGIVKRTGAIAVVAAGISTPLLAAGAWMLHGTSGPLVRANPDVFPLVVESQVTLPRILVLTQDARGPVTASVLRDRQPMPGEEVTQAPATARRRLRAAVAGLTSGTGGATALARFGVQYVLVPRPDRDPLGGALDAVPHLSRLSRTRGFALWQLTTPAGRLMLLDGATVTPLPAGPVDARVRIPRGGAGRTLLLAEPASRGWHATIDGRAARSRTVDGWAQAYDVPPAGGDFRLRRGMRLRHLWVSAQGLALMLVTLLALPSERWVGRPQRRRGRRRRRGRTAASPVLSGAES